MRNPLAPTAGLGVAQSDQRDCGGGSARRSSPEQRGRAVSVLGCGRKVVREALHSKHKTTQGLRGAVWCCSMLATARQRRRRAGVRAPATWVRYGLLDLAQQNEGGNAVFTEVRNRAGQPCRGGGSAETELAEEDAVVVLQAC
jgi:hypothetical protein